MQDYKKIQCYIRSTCYVNQFLAEHKLFYRVGMICTTYTVESELMTATNMFNE